jgi:hypothetical protein
MNFWRLAKQFFCTLLLGLVCACHAPVRVQPVNGAIDLQNWDFATAPLIELRGPWHTWPGDVYYPGIIPDTLFREIAPGPWLADGLPEQGTVNYRLTVHLPPNRAWGVLIGKVESAYRLMANGQEISSAGIAGVDREATASAYIVRTALLPSFDTPDINLDLIISNFEHPNGGLHGPIILGNWQAVEGYNQMGKFWEMFLFGAFAIFAIYHCILFFYRPKSREYLYFALLCLCFGLYCTIIKFNSLQSLFPNISGDNLYRIQQIWACLSICTGIGYFQRLFPTIISQRRSILNALLMIMYSVALLLIPGTALIYTHWTLFILSFISMVHIAIGIGVCLKVKAPFAPVILVGFSIITLTMAFDQLAALFWPELSAYSPYALLLVCIIQAYVLSSRFWSTYSSIQNLSKQLETQQFELLQRNAAHSRFVPVKFLNQI